MRFALLVALLLFTPRGASAWQRTDGTRIEGDPVGFNYEDKTLVFENPVTESTFPVPAEELSLRGRQRLLLSPFFHRSYPADPFWSPERRRLLVLAIFAPAVALLLGFWISAMLLARKAHPIRAVTAWLGSWMIGSLFVCFYLFFSLRLGGGAGTVLVGAGIGLVFLSFFISAIYDCTLFRGLLIFLLQVVAAGFLSVVALALTETFADERQLETFWNERVFAPVGLLEPNDSYSENRATRLSRYASVAASPSPGAQSAKTLSES